MADCPGGYHTVRVIGNRSWDRTDERGFLEEAELRDAEPGEPVIPVVKLVGPCMDCGQEVTSWRRITQSSVASAEAFFDHIMANGCTTDCRCVCHGHLPPVDADPNS